MVCIANGHAMDTHKLRYFPCNLRVHAMEWYVQHEHGHFTKWAALHNAFLTWFQQEKTSFQLIQKFYHLKQECMEPEDEFV